MGICGPRLHSWEDDDICGRKNCGQTRHAHYSDYGVGHDFVEPTKAQFAAEAKKLREDHERWMRKYGKS